jgi:integrase
MVRLPIALGCPMEQLVDRYGAAVRTPIPPRRVKDGRCREVVLTGGLLYREVLEQNLPWLNDLVRARRPQHLPVVMTRDEVRAVLHHLEGIPRLLALLFYGAGLRLLEGARLRVQDVDFAANLIVVRDGKGAKDRVTMLPAAVKTDLTRHLEGVRRQHEGDLHAGAGWVELPDALGRQYPNCRPPVGLAMSLSGFPATRLYGHRETRQRRRHQPWPGRRAQPCRPHARCVDRHPWALDRSSPRCATLRAGVV